MRTFKSHFRLLAALAATVTMAIGGTGLAKATPLGAEPQQIVSSSMAEEGSLLAQAATELHQAGYPTTWFDFENAETSELSGFGVFIPLKSDYRLDGRVLKQVVGYTSLPASVTGVLYVGTSSSLLIDNEEVQGLHFLLLALQASTFDPGCSIGDLEDDESCNGSNKGSDTNIDNSVNGTTIHCNNCKNPTFIISPGNGGGGANSSGGTVNVDNSNGGGSNPIMDFIEFVAELYCPMSPEVICV